MDYWLDPFSADTWQAFQTFEGSVTGFRGTHWQRALAVKPGDVLLCYLLRVKRWVGLLEVTARCYRSDCVDFPGRGLPVRFPVRTLVALAPEYGVAMESLRDRLSFHKSGRRPNEWIAHVRRSLTRYERCDGEAIAEALREAAENPSVRPVDPKKMTRGPMPYSVPGRSGEAAGETIVTIPTSEEEEQSSSDGHAAARSAPGHTEMQWRLLDLGVRLGMEVWAPRGDRGKTWSAGRIAYIPGLLEKLPTQFNVSPPVLRTIENIDVLWLMGGSIIAAFEVEHSTTIYSGLLRMADLVTMSPLINIKLYLVAPDERFPTFMREIARPTFASRATPLHTLCGFLPYSALLGRLEDGEDLIRFLKPAFLDDIAEFYDPSEEVDD